RHGAGDRQLEQALVRGARRLAEDRRRLVGDVPLHSPPLEIRAPRATSARRRNALARKRLLERRPVGEALDAELDAIPHAIEVYLELLAAVAEQGDDLVRAAVDRSEPQRHDRALPDQPVEHRLVGARLLLEPGEIVQPLVELIELGEVDGADDRGDTAF